MKTAAKVFLIISMVLLPLSFLIFLVMTLLINGALSDPNVLAQANLTAQQIEDAKNAMPMLIGITVATGIDTLVCEVLATVSIKKLGSATSKSELIPWGIVSLLFYSFLGGLFMLLVKDEDLKQQY